MFRVSLRCSVEWELLREISFVKQNKEENIGGSESICYHASRSMSAQEETGSASGNLLKRRINSDARTP